MPAANPAGVRPLDVVIWGATGYTGRFVAEHLASTYKGTVRWGLAGRSKKKLEVVTKELFDLYGAGNENIPVIEASLDDPASLKAMTQQAKVVIATAGPFCKLGTPIVDAAIATGTHYVDITGETFWVETLLGKQHEAAKAKSVRVVPFCAYDSVPSDIGTLFVVKHIKEALGRQTAEVTTVVIEGMSGVSGGTMSTVLNSVDFRKKTVKGEDGIYELVPPSARGSDKFFWGVVWEPHIRKYLTGFVMQICNSAVVHRSNYFLNYGRDFHYRDTVPAKSWLGAQAIRFGTLTGSAVVGMRWTHPLLRRLLPKPGTGPPKEKLQAGKFKHTLVGKTQEDDPATPPTEVVAEMGWNSGDAGYWGGARMALESALSLALDLDKLNADPAVQKGGVLTPASALGQTLIDRLKDAGFYFDILKNA